jgi:hypothetical protein
MKIVSDFKDFYDIGMSLGHDHELLYVRKREELQNNYEFEKYRFNSGWGQTFKNISSSSYTVGFCGKVYPVLYFVSYKDACFHKWNAMDDIAKWRKNVDYPNAFCFNAQDVDQFLEKHLNKDDWELYSIGHNSKWRRRYSKSCIKNDVAAFFDRCEGGRDMYKHVFDELKVPIFFVDSHNQVGIGQSVRWKNMIVNPCLKDVEFARVIDPYTAYQELTAYLSNIAKPEPFVPVPSDKDMVEIKGFDKKWSFRKKPEKDR